MWFTDKEVILILTTLMVLLGLVVVYVYYMYRDVTRNWQQAITDRVPFNQHQEVKNQLESLQLRHKQLSVTVTALNALLDTVQEDLSELLKDPNYGAVCNRQEQAKRNIMNNEQLRYISTMCSTVKSIHEQLFRD